MNAVVLKPGEGHALRLGDVQMVVKEDGTHTRGTLGLAEFVVPPHGHDVPPAHIHLAHEEGFYVLEGELEFVVGTQTVRAGEASLRDGAGWGRPFVQQSNGEARSFPQYVYAATLCETTSNVVSPPAGGGKLHTVSTLYPRDAPRITDSSGIGLDIFFLTLLLAKGRGISDPDQEKVRASEARLRKNASHGAFMTLSSYSRTREGAARQLRSSPKPCRVGLGVRNCSPSSSTMLAHHALVHHSEQNGGQALAVQADVRSL